MDIKTEAGVAAERAYPAEPRANLIPNWGYFIRECRENYKTGYIAGAEKYEALYREAIIELEYAFAEIRKGQLIELTLVIGEKKAAEVISRLPEHPAHAIIQKSKTISND